jgi:hypothetical protein
LNLFEKNRRWQNRGSNFSDRHLYTAWVCNGSGLVPSANPPIVDENYPYCYWLVVPGIGRESLLLWRLAYTKWIPNYGWQKQFWCIRLVISELATTEQVKQLEDQVFPL